MTAEDWFRRVSARCSGCGCESPKRPMGETPKGWTREYECCPGHGQGRYFCADCTRRRDA